jgi:hypothetical protein
MTALTLVVLKHRLRGSAALPHVGRAALPRRRHWIPLQRFNFLT